MAGEGEWCNGVPLRHDVAAGETNLTDLIRISPVTRRIRRDVVIETMGSSIDDQRLKEITWKIRDIVKAGLDDKFETTAERKRRLQNTRRKFKQNPSEIVAAIRSHNPTHRHAALIAALGRPSRFEKQCGREFPEALRFVIMNPLLEAPPPCRDGTTIYWQPEGEDKFLATICLSKTGSSAAEAVLQDCQLSDGELELIVKSYTPEVDRSAH